MKIYKILLFIVFGSLINAQPTHKNQNYDLVSFRWDNDFVFNTDKYFTNGFLLKYSSDWIKHSPFNMIFPVVSSTNNFFYNLTLVQNIYTPSDFSIPDPKRYDRPFAAYLLLGQGRDEYNNELNFISSLNFQIGFIGKNSFGNEIQNDIHNLLPNTGNVIGWENQIADELVANLSFNFEKQLIDGSFFSINWLADGKFGLPYLASGAGVKMVITNSKSYFSEFALSSNGGFIFEFYGSVINQLVLYDATLQGGIFSKSINTISKINNINGVFEFGAEIGFQKFELQLGMIYSTPKAEQLKSHKWGFLQIGFRL